MQERMLADAKSVARLSNPRSPERVHLRHTYKGLNFVFNRDRTKVAIYFRGRPMTADPIKEPQKFRKEADAVERGEPSPKEIEKAKGRAVQGTWDAAIEAYKSTNKYQSKAANTRRAYRPFIEQLRGSIGGQLIRETEPWLLFKMHDDVVQQQGPVQANAFLTVLANVVHVARLRGWVKANVDLLLGIEHQKVESNSHRPYKDEEIEAWRAKHRLGTMAWATFELAYGLALANVDLIRFAPCHIDDIGNVFIDRAKTKNTQSSNVNIDPTLQAAIKWLSEQQPADGPKDAMGRSTVPFLANQYGKPFQGSTFRKQWRRWAIEAGLPEDFTLHGARATMVTDMIDAGVAHSDGMKVTGHADTRVYERVYGKQASISKAAGRAQDKALAARGSRKKSGPTLRVVKG